MVPGMGGISGGKGGVSNSSSAATGDTMTGDTSQGGGVTLMSDTSEQGIPWAIIVIAAAGVAGVAIWKA